ncbi:MULTISPECIES: hypothetical protein [Streptomyces]|uniref:hypothetical protein n=1 Tax=Streptomyces TaxID=1883 RepID=UPI001487E83F|nr:MULTISPECIES: hypothetical protein [Streptomyces]
MLDVEAGISQNRQPTQLPPLQLLRKRFNDSRERRSSLSELSIDQLVDQALGRPWLRSLQAAAIVHRFGRRLAVDGDLNVHEK